MAGKNVGIRGAGKSTLRFLKPVRPDDTLSAITGTNPRPLSELIKRIWTYIQRQGLQDMQCRAIINADEKLRALFNGKGRVTVLEMFKHISSHVAPVTVNAG